MNYTIEIVENGGVTTPQGYRAAGVVAGLKRSERPDFGLLVSDARCEAAGVFTRNRVKGASLRVTQERLQDGFAQAILVNSGNANACNGEQGVSDARAMAKWAAERLGIAENDVLPNSTGVIGVPLPMDTLAAAFPNLIDSLEANGSEAFARAMMTTDNQPKFAARRVTVGERTFCIGAAAKGAGMIHPNMGTMFAFITTDALIGSEHLNLFLREVCDTSFNRFTIDGDTSCCDTVLLLANGAACQEAIIPAERGEQMALESFVWGAMGLAPQIHPDDPPMARAFLEALSDLCQELVYRLARDGEGVNHVVTIRVEGALRRKDATAIARAITVSPLVKTALHGCDPNWGRIVNAAGYSGAEFDPAKADLWIGDIQVTRAGAKTDFVESQVHEAMKAEQYEIRLDLNEGDGADFYITTDFSKEYVEINADYMNRT